MKTKTTKKSHKNKEQSSTKTHEMKWEEKTKKPTTSEAVGVLFH